jgi:hypothetical protein
VSAVEDSDGPINAAKGGGFQEGQRRQQQLQRERRFKAGEKRRRPLYCRRRRRGVHFTGGPGSGFSGAVLLPLDVQGEGQPLQKAL